jgi:hypothetical protein
VRRVDRPHNHNHNQQPTSNSQQPTSNGNNCSSVLRCRCRCCFVLRDRRPSRPSGPARAALDGRSAKGSRQGAVPRGTGGRRAGVGLVETALLERAIHTARSPKQAPTAGRRTRPRRTPEPPGPGLEVTPGEAAAGSVGSALRANPLPAPLSRAAKGSPASFRWQSKAGGAAKPPAGFKSKGGGTSAVACGASKNERK